MISIEHMSALPHYFKDIPDTRRSQGRRHPQHVVLALAAGATLCGMEGYKAIGGWVKVLGAKARERFGCRIDKRVRIVPSESTLRDVLIRTDPVALDRALARCTADYGQQDQSLAIDGKTLCNAIDEEGWQTHIMGVVGHDSFQCYTEKSRRPAPRGKGRGQANQSSCCAGFPITQKTLARANKDSERPFTTVEQEDFPSDHAMLGCLLAQNWWLPEEICQAMRHHHNHPAIDRFESGLPLASRLPRCRQPDGRAYPAATHGSEPDAGMEQTWQLLSALAES